MNEGSKGGALAEPEKSIFVKKDCIKTHIRFDGAPESRNPENLRSGGRDSGAKGGLKFDLARSARDWDI